MSIALIAREVYRCQSRVHRLEEQLAVSATPLIKEQLRNELRVARAELNTVRSILEGRKASGLDALNKQR